MGHWSKTYAVRPRKPGFLGDLGLAAKYFAKNPVSGYPRVRSPLSPSSFPADSEESIANT